MKYFFIMLSLLIPIDTSAAPKLEGRWKSDRELTMRFLESNVRLQEKGYDFMRQILGRMTLKFTADQMITCLPSNKVVIEGKSKLMEGMYEKTLQLNQKIKFMQNGSNGRIVNLNS